MVKDICAYIHGEGKYLALITSCSGKRYFITGCSRVRYIRSRIDPLTGRRPDQAGS